MNDEYMMINKWIIEIIVCLWNLALMIALLIKLYCTKEPINNKTQTSIPKAVLFSAIASFLGFPICYTIKLIMYMINPTPTDSIKTIKYTVIWFSFAVSRLSFYIFMLSRLYYSFHALKAYQINNRILYIHIMIVLITPFYIATMIYLQGTDMSDTYYIIGSIVCIVILFFGSLHIIYVFNMKLYSIISTRIICSVINDKAPSRSTISSKTGTVSSAASSPASPASPTSPTGSEEDKGKASDLEVGSDTKLEGKIFAVITRNTILASITTVMFIFIIILYGVFSFCELDRVQWTILAYLQVLGINIASFCVYLSFGVNEKLYKKCCKLDAFCNDIVERNMPI